MEKTIRDNMWQNNFKLFMKFSLLNKRLPKQNEKYGEFNIGSWLSTQKTNIKKNKIIKRKTRLITK